MVTINIKDHVDRAYNGDDGAVINKILLEKMNEGEKVTLSFKGIDSVSSSFVNTALIVLLNHFTFEQIKNSVRFTSTNEQINDMIRSRFYFEVNRMSSVQ